jgi:hypothetical protein
MSSATRKYRFIFLHCPEHAKEGRRFVRSRRTMLILIANCYSRFGKRLLIQKREYIIEESRSAGRRTVLISLD